MNECVKRKRNERKKYIYQSRQNINQLHSIKLPLCCANKLEEFSWEMSIATRKRIYCYIVVYIVFVIKYWSTQPEKHRLERTHEWINVTEAEFPEYNNNIIIILVLLLLLLCIWTMNKNNHNNNDIDDDNINSMM